MLRLMLAWVMMSLVLSTSAAPPKTSDLVMVSGSRAVWKWSNSDVQRAGAGQVYVAFDSIVLVPRQAPSGVAHPQSGKGGTATPSRQIQINMWIRGIPEANLFLLDGKGGPPDAASACGAGRHWWLNFPLSSALTVGYSVCIPVKGFDKAHGEIVVAADSAEPERFEVSFERQEGFLESPVANALLSPALAALGGIIAGAAIGYLGFLAQQRYLRKSEQTKVFRERKMQSIHELVQFFHDAYPIYRDSTEPDESVKLKELRECLIESKIYAILAPDEIARLNRVFNSDSKSRLAELDRIMAENFGEFLK